MRKRANRKRGRRGIEEKRGAGAIFKKGESDHHGCLLNAKENGSGKSWSTLGAQNGEWGILRKRRGNHLVLPRVFGSGEDAAVPRKRGEKDQRPSMGSGSIGSQVTPTAGES